VAPAEEFWPEGASVRSWSLLSPRSWLFKRRASASIWFYSLQQAAARSSKEAEEEAARKRAEDAEDAEDDDAWLLD